MTSRACILGCAGPVLSDQERAFFRDVRPWGFILFARNIETADQTRALIAALREAADDEGALVFVDQEGGGFSVCAHRSRSIGVRLSRSARSMRPIQQRP